MAATIQCANCGALLKKEDVFCGECGAPQPLPDAEAGEAAGPSSANGPGPATGTPVTVAPASGSEPSSAKAGWRVAVIVLLAMGVVVCLIGLVAFVLFGSLESEATTPAEDWLYSAMCCLLPISGTGLILTIVGSVLWYMRLRDR